jgi:DNA invertase Pin-like site-specific DNA recombinase
MSVHAYLRLADDDKLGSAHSQRESVRAYCRQAALLREGSEPLWYCDGANSGTAPLRDREAGRVLCANLRKGDHVVIARLDRAFRSLKDFVRMLDAFDRWDACLHVCDLAGRAVDWSRWPVRFLVELLGAVGDLDRAARAERAGAESRGRRERGEGLGAAPLGFRYAARYRRTPSGRRMQRRLKAVPCEYEREVMRLILGWRRQHPPLSWDAIRQRLNFELRLPTRSGRHWTLARIRRACEAEAVLQRREADLERIRSEIRTELAGPIPAPEGGAPG